MKKEIKNFDYSIKFEVMVYIVLIFICFVFILGFQFPTILHQNKQMTCLDNGYFDYDKEKDACYDLGHINVDSFECVKEGKCKGRHYEQ